MKERLPYRLIVTSGPTREWLDPVRFISNPSTGRTGWHLATSAKGCFEEVVYICGPVAHPYQSVDGIQNISVESTIEMHNAVHNSIRDNSILVMTAAPVDYRLRHIPEHKIKKNSHTQLNLELFPTVDILKSLIPIASDYTHFYRIGFAAETQDIVEQARKKLKEKELSLICANQVYKNRVGFGNNMNTLLVLEKSGKLHSFGPALKKDLVVFLLNIIIEELIPKEALAL